MLRRPHALGLCFILLLPICAFSQGPILPPSPQADLDRTYPKSSDGLRWQLQDIWNAARDRNPARLESLIKLTEIPDAGWFTQTFTQDKGQGWSEAYAKNLADSEKNLEGVMTRLAGEDGEFWVRNIKYEPAPAREVEGALIDSLRQPVDIFFASWKERDSAPGSKSIPIGYFVFIDGRFRWDSAMVPADIPSEDGKATRPGVGGVGYPQCVSCPDPHYSELARKKGLEGTVLMEVIVQPDGSVTDVKVVKSPDAELSDLAAETVSTWRLKPARLSNGEPVRVQVAVQVTFRLQRQPR